MAQVGYPGFGGYYQCDHCDGLEERVFIDSWTGMELCLMCLSEVAMVTTMGPSEDGDNLKQMLNEHRPQYNKEGAHA